MVANGRSMRKVLKESGYSQAYADHPSKFRKTKAGQDLMKWIDEENAEIRKCMKKTRNKAKYKELADVHTTQEKLKLLLKGEPTDRSEISIQDFAQNLFGK